MLQNLISIFIFSLSLLFVGCSDVKIETEVKASDFLAGKELKSSARISIDLDSCQSRKDPYEYSAVLKYAIKTMDKIFVGAEFSHCEESDYSYNAIFNIPILINSPKKGNSYIKINSDEDGYLSLYIPSAITYNVESEISGNFNPLDPKLLANISFYNDTNEEIEVFCRSCFVDKKAMISQKLTISERDVISIDLSNISLIEALSNETGVILK